MGRHWPSGALIRHPDLQQMPNEGEDRRWTHRVSRASSHSQDCPRNVHYFILAGDGFALQPWLMKRYGKRPLKREAWFANYRISRDRRVAENAFGILASRCRALLKPIEQYPDTAREIALTCIVPTSWVANLQSQTLTVLSS